MFHMSKSLRLLLATSLLTGAIITGAVIATNQHHAASTPKAATVKIEGIANTNGNGYSAYVSAQQALTSHPNNDAIKASAIALAKQPVSATALAQATTFMASHPLQGHMVFFDAHHKVLFDTANIGTSGGKHPNVSVGFSWYGWDLYLTVNDVHNIWQIIWEAGLGGAGAALCSPGVVLSIVCGILGAAIGYLVAELVWNYSQWNCGLDIRGYIWGGNSVYLWHCQ